jgi:hypothetical protein
MRYLLLCLFAVSAIAADGLGPPPGSSDASTLGGATFAAPGAIGSGTPAAGTFTSLTTSAAAADTINDAITNTTSVFRTVTHTSSGTVANFFGTQTLFNLEDDGGTSRNAGAINVIWSTAATATRSSSIAFQTVSSGAALATQLSVGATGVTVTGTLNAVGVTCTGTQALTVTQTAWSGAIRTALAVTPANGTLITSGTENPAQRFNAHTFQWATSTPTTQRAFLIDQPTYSCNTAAQTITTAATVNIVGPPIASTNVTITNRCALRIEAGHLEMVGTTGNSLRITTATANATTACVFTAASGPAGAQTAIQGWLLINVAGTDRYMPFWATPMHSPRWAEYRDAWLNGRKVSMTMREYEDECAYCLDVQ